MKFTKWNNPSKKRRKRKMSRTDADIIAGKMMIEDRIHGEEMPLKFYDHVSDKLCGQPSRGIM